MRLGLRSRRETFERCLRTAAVATPGFTLRLGHVERVLAHEGRASGVVVDGVAVAADLVVDASGRSGRATRPWRSAPGSAGRAARPTWTACTA